MLKDTAWPTARFADFSYKQECNVVQNADPASVLGSVKSAIHSE